MIWSCFLHFYQPPTQKKYWVDRVTSECYLRLVEGFLAHPQARVTLNINALLFEFWDRYGHQDVLDGIRKLLERGQIELTGTAKYHPLLPKLPEEEIARQIELNDEASRKFLGELYRPRGFFPPEMAYDRKVARVAASLGYEWIIAEELSLNHEFGMVDYSKIYEISRTFIQNSNTFIRTSNFSCDPNRTSNFSCDEGIADKSANSEQNGKFATSSSGRRLKIFFRERGFSYKILSGQLGTPKLFLDALGDRIRKDEYLLTAMDGETFGHHRPGMDRLLMKLFELGPAKTVLISELLNLFESGEVVKTLPSTWALMSHDLEKNIPFARWEDPDNEIHELQWQLTDLAIEAVRNSKHQTPERVSGISRVNRVNGRKPYPLSPLKPLIQLTPAKRDLDSGLNQGKLKEEQRRWLEARTLLDRALHSDQYWWASARPWWSLEMIERGAKELLETVLAVPNERKRKPRLGFRTARNLVTQLLNQSINQKFGLLNYWIIDLFGDFLTEQEKAWIKAKVLYRKIVEVGFDWQREGRVEAMAKTEDEAVRMRTDEGIPELPPEEIDKMIAVIRKEMLEVAADQEYERAAQLRDRIKELEGYKKTEFRNFKHQAPIRPGRTKQIPSTKF